MADIPIRCFIASVVAVRHGPEGPEVLLLRRTGTLAGTWCQVAGGIEEGETAWQTGLRELHEETGLTPTAFYSADICEQFYEADRDSITLAPVFVAFIDPEAQVTLNPEHDAFQWLGFDAAIEAVPFGGQRRILRWIHEEFIRRTPSPLLQIALP